LVQFLEQSRPLAAQRRLVGDESRDQTGDKAIKSGAEGRTEPLPFGIVGMPDPDRDLAPLAQLRSRHERPNRG
jgi:hypothetical protein